MKRLSKAAKDALRAIASEGGKAAAKKMTPAERRERARKAVAAREAKRRKNK